MEIVHNQSETKSFSLSPVKRGKQFTESLQSVEKELLFQMSEAFTIINGGHFKRKRQSA